MKLKKLLLSSITILTVAVRGVNAFAVTTTAGVEVGKIAQTDASDSKDQPKPPKDNGDDRSDAGDHKDQPKPPKDNGDHKDGK